MRRSDLLAFGSILATLVLGTALALQATQLVLPPVKEATHFDVIDFVLRLSLLSGFALIEYWIANILFRRVTGRPSLWRWMNEVASRLAGSSTGRGS